MRNPHSNGIVRCIWDGHSMHENQNDGVNEFSDALAINTPIVCRGQIYINDFIMKIDNRLEIVAFHKNVINNGLTRTIVVHSHINPAGLRFKWAHKKFVARVSS